MRSLCAKAKASRALLLLTLLLSLIPAAAPAQAQAAAHRVAPGDTITGVIDADHLTQMYVFTQANAANEVAQLENTGSVPLALAALETTGSRLGVQTAAPGSTVSLSWPTRDGATYYLLVFPVATAGGSGSFRLSLSGIPISATPTAVPPTVTINEPLQFTLTWQAGARLSLEVRDPQGQSVHWRSPQTTDGGSFSGDSDPIDCAAFTPHAQTQTAAWNAPVSGSYEILVHYVDGCAPDIPFTVRARLGSTDFPALSGTLPGTETTFVGGFVIGADGRAALNLRSGIVGAAPALDSFSTADLTASAQPLAADGSATGHISSDQPYRSFSFEGTLGAIVTATAARTSGSLDTLLVLMDSNGNLVAYNDDAGDATTDSAFSDVRLRHSGTYLLVVTRYAETFGATEGDFRLTLSLTGS